MQNILTGKGIRLLSGERDPPKAGHGKWDYLNVSREILGSSSKINVNQPGERSVVFLIKASYTVYIKIDPDCPVIITNRQAD